MKGKEDKQGEEMVVLGKDEEEEGMHGRKRMRIQ